MTSDNIPPTVAVLGGDPVVGKAIEAMLMDAATKHFPSPFLQRTAPDTSSTEHGYGCSRRGSAP